VALFPPPVACKHNTTTPAAMTVEGLKGMAALLTREGGEGSGGGEGVVPATDAVHRCLDAGLQYALLLLKASHSTHGECHI
jgi:hypothetical protein